MKKTLLFSAVLLFSAATFAQTSVKNNEAIKGQTTIQSDKSGIATNGSANASSTTSIHSYAVKNTEQKSSVAINKEHKNIVDEKQRVSTKTKEEGKKTGKLASDDLATSTSVHSNAKVDASGKGNNLSNNTSVKSNENLSTSRIKSKSTAVKNQEKARIKTKADAAVKNTNHLKANVNKTTVKTGKKTKTASTTAVHHGTVHSIKVKPVSVKTRAQINTNASIKIK